MNILPILNNHNGLHEYLRIPLSNDRLLIAAHPTDADLREAQEGDMFLNPDTGYCCEYSDQQFVPVSPAVAQSVSGWMEDHHPRLHSRINWDGQPHWTDS